MSLAVTQPEGLWGMKLAVQPCFSTSISTHASSYSITLVRCGNVVLCLAFATVLRVICPINRINRIFQRARSLISHTPFLLAAGKER